VPIRRNFSLPSVVLSGADDQWQAELIDLHKLKSLIMVTCSFWLSLTFFQNSRGPRRWRTKQARPSSKPARKF